MPPLPPIPPQITPSSGEPRRAQRPAGQWLSENNATPPPGSFEGDEGYSAAATSSDTAAQDGAAGDGAARDNANHESADADSDNVPSWQRAASATGGGT
jgi:phospholipid/cholesterol/gamma-HCH transport system ATP-binding protein